MSDYVVRLLPVGASGQVRVPIAGAHDEHEAIRRALDQYPNAEIADVVPWVSDEGRD